MGLVSPILDDRTYQELRDELVARIPVHTPAWTDHNESDPGIALLELFAHLGESVLYRLNQLPETVRIEFLRLLGVRRRPAVPAQVLLAAGTDAPAGVAVPRQTAAAAGSLVFETTGATHVWPVTCVAVGKTEAPKAPVGDVAEADRRDDARARVGLQPGDPAVFYESTQVAADPLAPDAVPLDVALTVDEALWIAVLRTATTDLRALGGRSLFVGFAFDELIERPFDLEDLDDDDSAAVFDAGTLTADPPPMLWRLWQGPGRGFATLDVGDDSTRGLVTTGVVEVELPPQLPVLDPGAATPGDLESPPPLTDEEQAASVVAWLQVSRPRTEHLTDPVGKIRWVALNAVLAEHARTASPEQLGSGTGDTDQRYPLTKHPVLPGSTRLQVAEPDGLRDWVEVDTYLVSGPEDRHFTVDHDSGAVIFDGRKLPQLGERIQVTAYRYGGGAAGNVAAGSITRFQGVGGVDVSNPLPATGGADAAGLDEAMDEIPAEVHRRDRCVTAEDFREMALRVSGVGRAETLMLLHPENPSVEAAGVVSVVVLPVRDLSTPQAPLPGYDLLRRVAAYLDVRRLATTELYVVPPTYVPIAFSIGLAVRTGYQVDAVRGWVDQILRQYLAALPPAGPDGAGWTLGRTVRAAELEAVAVQVEGVEFVEGSSLARVVDDEVVPTSEIGLARWELPELTSLTVVRGAALAPGAPYEADGPDDVLVPLPPDVC
jgi:predicted phage baseplate assembly protein